MQSYTLNGDLAEETGIHVGDGSMNVYSTNGSCYTVAGHEKDDKSYIDSVVLPLIKRVYGKNPKPRPWSEGTYGFRICSKAIVSFKHEVLGLPLGTKKDIKVPKLIRDDDELMKRFIRGLFDTDGSITLWKTNNKLYPRIYFVSISKKLVDEVRTFLSQQGFRVTYWENTPKQKDWKKNYRLSINGVSMLKKWAAEIGFNNPKNLAKLQLYSIK